MIEAFECDFVLAKEDKYLISKLESKLMFKDENLMADIDLLEELSYLLRYGKAEIHLVEEPKTKADRIRSMSDEELAEFIIKVRDCCSTNYCEGCPFGKNGCSKKKICDWLQSEAE